jgi:hypothetical protein
VDAVNGCSSSPIETLIDHGCPPVLISKDFTMTQGYPLKKLKKAYKVSMVIGRGNQGLDQELDHYCRLSFISPDYLWRSCTIDAIICPGLQMNIALGLHFLAKNKIMVDAELHTAVNKETNYDLLNSPEIKRPQFRRAMSPKQKRATEQKATEMGCMKHRCKWTVVMVNFTLTRILRSSISASILCWDQT